MPDYHCGILFVHGIGEQRRGDTLIDAADPLVRWLQRWLATSRDDRPSGKARLIHARLSEDANDPGTPAHAVLEIGVTGADRSACTQRWLLAEGRWAEEVRMPAFSSLAAWLLTTGAWILLSHAARAATAHQASRWRYVTIAQAVVLSLVAVPVMQFVVFVLAVVAALPIPRLRAALSDVLLRASGVLGDSYVLLESAVQRQAIVASVRRHLRWLAGQCGTVAVIAHSQGAAVAHHALRDADPANVSLFITYGSGLAKLEEIELMRQRHGGVLRTAQWGFPLALVGGVIALRIWSEYSADPWAGRAVLVAGAPLLIALGALVFAFERRGGLAARLKELSLRPVRAGLDWFDLYGSADPVSNGPLTTPDARIKGMVSRQVSNMGSVLGDHTAYWRNETEFIPAVVRRLDRHLRLGLCSKADARVLKAAAISRRLSVRGLTAARWGAVAAAIGLVWVLRRHMVDWGAGVFTALRLPVVSALGDIVTKPATAMAELVSRMTGADVAITERYFFGAFGMLLVIAAVALWHRGSRAVWSAWQAQQAGQLFARMAPVNDRGWLAALGGVAAIPALVAIAMLLWPAGRTVTITELRVYQLLGVTIVALYWAFAMAAVVRVAMQVRRERSVSPAAVWPTLFFIGFAVAFTPGLVPWRLLNIVVRALVALIAIGVMSRWLSALADHARRTVRWWRVVAALPVVLAVLYTIAVLVRGLGTATETPVLDALLGGAGVYMLTLGALSGGLWLIDRVRRARSGVKTEESAVIGE